MSYEFWVEAEKFLYDSFFINLIILGFIFIFIINRLSFLGDNNSKASNIIFSIIIIVFITFTINTTAKFNKYKILYEYDKYVNYGIRSNKKTFLTYKYPSRVEKNLYSKLYLVDNFRNLGIYNQEKICEEVEFLGRDEDNFYFQHNDQIIYRKLGDHLEIVDDISNPIREGVKFYLKDSRFEDIGFSEKSPYTYLLNYKIPESESNMRFENPDNLQTLLETEITLGWINPTSANKLSLSKEIE